MSKKRQDNRRDKRRHKPWHLKVTWTLSLVMLLLIAGFFYQSYLEMRQIAPVKVAVERVGQSAGQGGEREPRE